MKKSYFLAVCGAAVLAGGHMAAAGEVLELDQYYAGYKFTDADWVSGAEAFGLAWDELQVRSEEAILNVWYTGEQANRRTRVDIGSISGAGTLELEGSSTNALVLFRVGDDGMAGFEGNLTLRHYSSEWDAAEMYDSAVVLEFGRVEMPGAVALDVAGYCPDDCFYVAALGLGDDATLGGLDSADYAAPAAVVYSGKLREDAAALLHRAGFASYVDFERHTLTIDTAGVHRYHGALLGAMDVVKRGTGTQYFTVSGANAGNTYRVLGGKLVFAGAVEATALEVGSGASFSCSGSLTLGELALQSGNLSANGALAVTTVSLSGSNEASFTSCSGGSWVFTLGAENTATPLLVLEGSAAPAQVQLVYDESELCRGWYQLVQCSSGAWTLPQQVLVNGAPAQLEWSSGVLRYYVADGQRVLPRNEATQLHWQTQSGKWQENAGHAENYWQGPDSNANFLAGDEVFFGSAARVELVGEVKPSAVWVTHGAGEVCFAGSGKLAGELKLHQTGTGTLRVSGANTYSGTTELKHGRLVVEHADALGSSTVLMKGGELDLQETALDNKLVVQGETALRGASHFAGKLELQSGSLLVGELGDSASISCTGNAALLSSGTLVLHQQLELDDAAVLTLSGTFEAGELAESTEAFMETAHGTTGGESGFVRDAGCRVQLTTGHGTLDTTNAGVLLHGTAVQLNETGYGELPGALRTAVYTVAGDHEVRVSEIVDIAGEKLQSIRMSSGRLLVDESTHTLDCSGGELVLQQGHVSGRIGGDCRVVVQGDVVLASAHAHTDGTWVESGSFLRLANAAAPGAGSIYLGSPARRAAQSAVLDMSNLPVQNNLVLRGSSELRGTEAFAGDILMESGAECTVAAGNVLRLDAGQSLTLAPGGNVVHGELVFNGGTVVLTGGALTLHGLCAFTAPTTLDLRQWQNLALQQPLLVLDYPAACEEGDLLFLLPGHLAESSLVYNPLSGALELKSSKPIYSPLAAALNRNQLQVYHALLCLPEGTYGALAELQRNVAEAGSADELRNWLDRAGGAAYSALLPALQEGVRDHLLRMQELAGTGNRLTPDSSLSVAAQALYHTTRRSGDSAGGAYRLSQTGSHLQLETRAGRNTALGLALAAVSSRISPEMESTQKEEAIYLDAYTRLRKKHWQALLALGLGQHELSLLRQRTHGNSAATTAAAESLHLMGEFSCAIADDWQVYTSGMWSMARMDAITEQQDTASLHLAEQRNKRGELSLGTRWHSSLGDFLTLGTQAALHYLPGSTHHKTSAHFAGAPDVHFTQQSAAAPRWNYSLGAEITCPLTSHASLHAAATLQHQSFSSHAGIILHF